MGKRERKPGRTGARLSKETLKHCIDYRENSFQVHLISSLSILKQCFLGLVPAGLSV